MRIAAGLIAFCLATVSPALAQTVLAGDVAFANSGSPAAQASFLTGLALLHDFEYRAAKLAFQQAEAADPNFAMAYWGEAMTYNHPVWMQQDAAAARAALARLGPTPGARAAKAGTQRERDYLAAVEILYGDGDKFVRDFRYADAMAALHARYPDDVDATAFDALALLGTSHDGRDVATYMKSAALLEEVYPTHLRHPGVLHYMIHSYDDPIHAPLGLRAARRYGALAPDAPHALHMTSHIFIALGMWDETIAANQAAMQGAGRPGPRRWPNPRRLRPLRQLAVLRRASGTPGRRSQGRPRGVPGFRRDRQARRCRIRGHAPDAGGRDRPVGAERPAGGARSIGCGDDLHGSVRRRRCRPPRGRHVCAPSGLAAPERGRSRLCRGKRR